MNEIRDIFADAAVVVCLVLVIFGADHLSHWLTPPDGPVFFRYTVLEFPFQWLVDAAHIANFGGFLVRIVRRIWR
jgi:hypothetical protein